MAKHNEEPPDTAPIDQIKASDQYMRQHYTQWPNGRIDPVTKSRDHYMRENFIYPEGGVNWSYDDDGDEIAPPATNPVPIVPPAPHICYTPFWHRWWFWLMVCILIMSLLGSIAP